MRAGLATICATSAITVWGGEIPAAEAESVGMSTEGLKRDFETAIRQAIID